MDIAVITIFPEIFRVYLGESIMKRAVDRGIAKVAVHDLRDFAADKHRTVDDTPFGGGPGMVFKPEPMAGAIRHVLSDGMETKTVMLTPQGRLFNQSVAEELSAEKRRLLFICGRYEGIDERIRRTFVDEELSMGDYVLTGGELPALAVIDAVVRLLPGALGDEESLKEESFSWGILDYPHYTRPREWEGVNVPEVLLSGNHRQIALWRRKEALRLTLDRRPDLLDKIILTNEDKKLISEIKEEEG